MKKLILIISIVVFGGSIYATENDQQKVSSFIDSLKSAPSAISGFATGMAQSFGATPGSQYNLCYCFYNDTPFKVYAGKRFVANVQGANIWKDIDQQKLLDPFSNSGKYFYNMQLRFGVVMDYDASMNNDMNNYKNKVDAATRVSKSSSVVLFEHDEVNLGDPSSKGFYDPYFIHAYTKQGNLKIEFLGQRTTSTEFGGVFYNNSDTAVMLDFVKDAVPCKVTLEPHSFNTLASSGAQGSIRALATSAQKNKFVFSGGISATMDIPAEGFADTVYVYEIYNRTVGIQGCMPGGYDLVPVDGSGKQAPMRVRDINPVPCSIWWQTPEQQTTPAQTGMQYFTEPYPVWLTYASKDQTITKKLTPGVVSDVAIIRPQIDEKEAWLYIVMVLSTDASSIQKFLTRLQNGQIPGQKDAITSTLLADKPITLDDSKGILKDTGQGGSGVIAYLLLADVFLPNGLGFAPLYYIVPPSLIALDQLASMIIAYLDPQKFPLPQGAKVTQDQYMLSEVSKKCMQWITDYMNQKKSDDFKNYMTTNGAASLFTTQKTKTLSAYGQNIIKNLTTGPISIAHYPVMRFAANNNFSAAPDGMSKIKHVKL